MLEAFVAHLVASNVQRVNEGQVVSDYLAGKSSYQVVAHLELPKTRKVADVRDLPHQVLVLQLPVAQLHRTARTRQTHALPLVGLRKYLRLLGVVDRRDRAHSRKS